MPTFILLRNRLISSLSKLTGRRVTDWKFQSVQNRRSLRERVWMSALVL